MRHQSSRVVFIGDFGDYFYRINSYASASVGLGFKPSFLFKEDLSDRFRQLGADSVFIFNDEASIRYIANLGSDLGAPFDLVRRAKLLEPFTNKIEVRRMCDRLFPHDFISYREGERPDMEAIEELFRTHTEMIGKPAESSFSKDVFRLKTVEQTVRFLLDHAEASGGLLLERPSRGKYLCADISWNGYQSRVVGFCWRDTSFLERPVVLSHFNFETPPGVIFREIENKASLVFRQSGIDFPVTFHCEFTWDEETENLDLIEVNPRAPGGWLPDLYTLSGGFNFDQLVIENACGLESRRQFQFRPAALGAVLSEDFFPSLVGHWYHPCDAIFERFDVSHCCSTTQAQASRPPSTRRPPETMQLSHSRPGFRLGR